MQELTPKLLYEIFKQNQVTSIFIADENGGSDYRVARISNEKIKAEPLDKRFKTRFIRFDELVSLYKDMRLLAFVERQLNITSALV